MKISLRLGLGIVGFTAALALNSCGGGGGGGGSSKACAPAAVTAPTVTGLGDPLFVNQWHLENVGRGGGTAGEDVRVVPVWDGGNRGEGVRIAIVDDGLEITHEDLIANVVSNASYDYEVPGVCSPTGGEHGTAVAGVAAARDDNGVGGRGAAPRAELVGYNLLAAKNDANEADAMTRDRASNAISSNSWGAPDDRGTLDAPAQTWYDAIDTGLAQGRGGLGTIYVWAAGNGGSLPQGGGPAVDNSNYDGQANYRGVIPVCAVGDDGLKADYSEEGANLLVCAPSKGTAIRPGITTTDRTGAAGYDPGNYFDNFSGTSSAAPLAAGVIALVLQANPNLGWRDVRQIIAKSARQTDAAGGGWVANSANIQVSHKYGFGVIDADAAVTMARTWTPLDPEVTPFTQTMPVGQQIGDGSGDNGTVGFGPAVASSIPVTGSGIGKIDFVEVTFTSDHPYAGDLEIVLTRTDGIDSRLAETHYCPPESPCGPGYANGWRFGDMRHLDEPADGTWTLTVRDGLAGDKGTFQSWTLRIYGRAS